MQKHTHLKLRPNTLISDGLFSLARNIIITQQTSSSPIIILIGITFTNVIDIIIIVMHNL